MLSWIMNRNFLGITLALAVGMTLGPGRMEISGSTVPGVPMSWAQREPIRSQAPDSSDVLGSARSAQARFERQRRRLLPLALAASGGPCEERVGRFCMWHSGEDDWAPVPDPPELMALRKSLLDELAELTGEIPSDGWILGQRIFYLAEAGRWSEAQELAGACEVQAGWWCDVLLGFAQHGGGDYPGALVAFERGLSTMDPERIQDWRNPEFLLDGRARDLLNEADDEEWESLTAWFWMLADPLYLMAGNDRETEHYARWTFSEMSDRARNPHAMAWGPDLEELTVRYGWERGWEKRPPAVGLGRRDGGAIGHVLPESREFVAPGFVLERPWETEPGEWAADEHPRSSHVAAYAPDLVAGVGQVAVLHRGDSVLVAAATRLPEPADSSTAGSFPGATRPDPPDGPFPWAQPALLDEPDRVGLFLIDRERTVSGVRSVGASADVLTLSVPAGDYLMSLEAWSPSDGRGWRIRHGIVTDTIAEDLATLSDLIVLDATDPPWQRLDAALPYMRPSLELIPGQRISVGWEIFGLGWRPEVIDFELSLSGRGEGFFGKVGRWLGFGAADEPLRVGWREPGPGETGPWFRSVNMDIPELEAGEYLLRLELSVPGREPLVGTRTVEILGAVTKVAQPQDVRR